MAYKMAYEVVVCKKQNGSISASWRYCKPCNEKKRFLDSNFILFFLRLLGTFAAPLPHSQPCHKFCFVWKPTGETPKKRPRTNLYLRQQDLNFRLSKVFFFLSARHSQA